MKIFFTLVTTALLYTHPASAEPNPQEMDRERIDQTTKAAYIAAGANELYEEKIKDVLKVLDDHTENLKKEKWPHKNADGGQWIEYDAYGNPYPVIALVAISPNTPPLKKKIPKTAKIIDIEYSINELAELQDTILALFLKEKILLDGLVKSIGVEPKINKLSIHVAPNSAAQVQDFLENHGFDLKKINIQADDSMYQLISDPAPVPKTP